MKTTASYLRVILFTITSIGVIEYLYKTETEWAMFSQPMFWLIVGCLFLFALAFEVCIEALETVLAHSLEEDSKVNYLVKRKEEQERPFKKIKAFYKKMLGSKAIQEEHEIILDHNYDGIKELDNNLPPWWVYSFYATILFAIIYLVRFEVFNDYNQVEEYEAAVVVAKKEIAEWKKTAKNLVDINTVEVLTETSDLAAGKKIFEANCVACHKADGGGGIGPNLTDENWILGGGIKNVFKTISEGGRDGKGMISWKSDLKPLEIAQAASYVLTFQGTTPAEPKDLEGDLWKPEVTESVEK
ncbi:cbb3-type cytochrome c oxidase N-terminal domain-containing protein [Aurantibacter sp.]|uniref:cbb3-type cytochrome c oxidase N-terminal domain-containing protein n=1 Tax=Aurantibacter sp. TaxID=2807103 RepID=UPI0035C87491